MFPSRLTPEDTAGLASTSDLYAFVRRKAAAGLNPQPTIERRVTRHMISRFFEDLVTHPG